MTINVLDNPVWHALTGPHRRHATLQERAAHYPRDMAPFSAIVDASDGSYADLALDLPRGSEARLFRPLNEPMPGGWEEVDAFPMLQMIAVGPSAAMKEERAVAPLSLADTPAMLELVERSRPGPFGTRTPELGRYLGIKEGGRLMAMAGERLRPPGHVELSAICVHPEARGRGYGQCLTLALMRQAFSDGEVPFLHVRPDNGAAVSLYRKLGFTVRREIFVLWRRPR
ncbi:FR47-like protein [Enhydrobacter aerosaccus]|uniref:FR47-like protein n=1 Tax=Enhydrobacter aerosaccus TaxID=225324 RepID=A0A1T4RJ26_9HYPH|nr:GNAT family N-acetyltransferase [Enhydrobacter aerosaccus]SKA16000.1 FR47-like protein [Enhydrobacter aerosaccus]